MTEGERISARPPSFHGPHPGRRSILTGGPLQHFSTPQHSGHSSSVAANRRTDRGASLVEYALLVALIAIVCLVAVTFLGSTTGNSLNSTASQVSLFNS